VPHRLGRPRVESQVGSDAPGLLGIDRAAMRVITPHVGGGFGGKAGITAEHIVAIGAARKLERPVRWVETRSENMVALPHGRSQVQYIEMGFTRDVASRVCFLDAGRILEQGPPDQIFRDPTEARTRQFLDRVIAAGRM